MLLVTIRQRNKKETAKYWSLSCFAEDVVGITEADPSSVGGGA